MRPDFARGTRVAALLAGLAAVPWTAAAQPMDAAPASKIRAGMLLNFAKFVEWPAEAGPANPLSICVIDDAAVAEALEESLRGRSSNGRELIVRRLKADGAVRECHVLYASGLNRERATQLLDRVKEASVFTVSDFEGFAPMGGVVQFFMQGNRMRFAINPAAAQRARLRVSAQVLSVGTIVKDAHAQ